ncbi:hypothetical protein, partial [Bacillus cereus]|uniref:hypothetical protein n=1 Tax=Bacillus cereus TaxID=1396 RepID=UPI001A7E6773
SDVYKRQEKGKGKLRVYHGKPQKLHFCLARKFPSTFSIFFLEISFLRPKTIVALLDFLSL